MPLVNEYKCNKCGLTLQRGWGYHFYVEDDRGDRIDCHHPQERRYVEQVLGKSPPLESVHKRTGFNSFCVCLDCLHQFKADLGVPERYWSPYELYLEQYMPRPKQGKDERKCPKCKSKNVKTELDLVGKACPKCKKGVIEEIPTGAIA